MKKIIAIALAAVLLLALTACGGSEPAATTAAPTTAAPAAQVVPEAQIVGGDKEADSSDIIVEDGTFSFTFEGVELIPGQAFDASALPAPAATSTIPSCAFSGTDNVYTYDTIEIIAYDEGNGEHLYSVYLLDPNTATNEGLMLGDSVEQMVSIYGDGYTNNGSEYAYYRGETILVVLAKNDVINSIEIRMAG